MDLRGDGLEKGGRYDVSGLIEAQYEPGSDDSVLRNLLGIVDSEEMDRVEARALSETHTEMLLVHPFRDGNGRIARLLSTLMALQAGLPLLDFSLIRGLEKRKYILAVQAGLSRDYQIMDAIFSGVIEKSISGSAE